MMVMVFREVATNRIPVRWPAILRHVSTSHIRDSVSVPGVLASYSSGVRRAILDFREIATDRLPARRPVDLRHVSMQYGLRGCNVNPSDELNYPGCRRRNGIDSGERTPGLNGLGRGLKRWSSQNSRV